MYKKTTALSVAISLALGTAAAFAPVAAQAEEQQVEKLQKMKVTGSRISTTDMEGPNPVDVYTADDIAKMGAVSVDDVLRGLTQNGAGSYGSSFTNSFAAGTSGVSLRGLGASRTLVLLNGRRVANYSFAQNLNDTFVDLNSIPLSAVERIDVLKDGASAIYGSDAIGGVVNVILKRDYEGFDVSFNGGQTSYSDGEDLDVTLTGGKTINDKTNIMASLNVVKKGEIWMKDRPNTKTADLRSKGGADWRSWGGTPGYVFGASSSLFDSLCEGPDENCKFDYNPEIAMLPESERYNFLTSLNHQLNEDTNVFAELSINRVFSKTVAAQTPDFGEITIAADNPNNPYGEDVFMYHRIVDGPNRVNEITTDSVRFVAGAEGYANWFETDVDWTLDAGYHYTTTESLGKGYISRSGYQEAVDSGLYNPFVLGNDPASLSGAIVNTKREGESKLGFVNAGASFPVFELAGGDAYLAIGSEIRYEAGSDTPDPLGEAGEIIGSGGTSSEGDRTVFAGYAELVAPVLEQVEVQLAGRAEHYSDFGSAFSPKVAIRYQPMDALLFRASYSEGFKAPTLPEVNAGASTSYVTVDDPVTGKNGQVKVVSQGNKDLEAETAKTFNIGAVIEPIEDLSVKVDYFHIVNEDKIDTLGAQKLVDEDTNVTRKANGDIDYVIDEYLNIAKQQVSGIDSEIKYDLATDSYGDFLVKLAGTYNIEFKQSDSDGNIDDYIGTYYGGPRFKGKATLGYGFADFAFTNIVNYTHSYDTLNETEEHTEVEALTTWDTQLAYTGIENATIAVGVRNVTNELAPFYNEAEGYDFGFHDNTGRFYYLQLEYGF